MKPVVTLPQSPMAPSADQTRAGTRGAATTLGHPTPARARALGIALAVALCVPLSACSGSELAATWDLGADARGDAADGAKADVMPDAHGDLGHDVLADGADAGPDGAVDTDTSTEPDTPLDAAQDGEQDSLQDAVSDALSDATGDGGQDVMPDAGPDTVLDAGPDVGLDADADAMEPDAGCAHDEDCAAIAGPCLVGTCHADTGECAFAPAADGAACDDGNLCSQGDTCAGGLCVGGAPVVCQDDNPCTDEVCLPDKGCMHTFNFAPCDDGDPCTTGDHCSGGTCVGGSTACDDDNPCTTDTCDAATGLCVFDALADGTGCDDGSECTAGDACQGGVCVPGASDGCDDGNPCTATPCAGGVTCGTVPLNGEPCDDGDPCTLGDVCLASACVSGPPDPCDDDNPCTVGTCAAPGGCTYELTPGASCEDGDACTTGDTCDASGACVSGPATSCDDDNPCTADSCDTAQGCLNEPVAGACPTPSACFSAGTCVEGVCESTPVDCDDGDACTEDACDPVTGCEHVDISASCDDGNPCTLDTCDPATGCSSAAQDTPCDDGDPCTDEDTCATGACAGTPLDCDDGDPCTVDACTPEQGCVHAAFTGPCDDGDACTEGESCDEGGQCGGGTTVDVDDGVDCTLDACDPTDGVTHTPDNDACPVGHTCDAGAGCVLGPIQIVISRVQLVPAGAPTPNDDGQGQWLAVTNVGEIALDLRQVTLATPAAGPAPLAATSGAPGAPLVLAPGETLAGIKASGEAVDADFAFVFGTLGDGFALDPAGDTITVATLDGAVLDTLPLGPAASGGAPVAGDAWPVTEGSPLSLDAQALAAAQTAKDDDLAASWCAAPGVGPLDPAPDCRRVRLNEVHLGGPDGARWIELYAPAGGPLTDLRVRVLDATGAGLTLTLVPDGRAPVGALPVLQDGVAGVALPALTTGAVQLFQDQELIDVYGFGNLLAAVDASQGLPLYESTPGPAEGAGQAAQRAADGVDTDDNAADWQLVDDGTPGALNAP